VFKLNQLIPGYYGIRLGALEHHSQPITRTRTCKCQLRIVSIWKFGSKRWTSHSKIVLFWCTRLFNLTSRLRWTYWPYVGNIKGHLDAFHVRFMWFSHIPRTYSKTVNILAHSDPETQRTKPNFVDDLVSIRESILTQKNGHAGTFWTAKFPWAPICTYGYKKPLITFEPNIFENFWDRQSESFLIRNRNMQQKLRLHALQKCRFPPTSREWCYIIFIIKLQSPLLGF